MKLPIYYYVPYNTNIRRKKGIKKCRGVAEFNDFLKTYRKKNIRTRRREIDFNFTLFSPSVYFYYFFAVAKLNKLIIEVAELVSPEHP